MGEVFSKADQANAYVRMLLYSLLNEYQGDDECLAIVGRVCKEIVRLLEAKGIDLEGEGDG